MELDDLKSTWNSGRSHTEREEVTLKMIDRMTTKKYRSKMKKITYPEMIGSLICIAGAVYIGARFSKLDTPVLQGVGLLSIVLLGLLPLISFFSLQNLRLAEDVNKPCADILKTFAIYKLRFYKLQKISIILSYLLLLTVTVLLTKFFGDKDLTNNKRFWIFSFAI